MKLIKPPYYHKHLRAGDEEPAPKTVPAFKPVLPGAEKQPKPRGKAIEIVFENGLKKSYPSITRAAEDVRLSPFTIADILKQAGKATGKSRGIKSIRAIK